MVSWGSESGWVLNTKLSLAFILWEIGSYREFWTKRREWSTVCKISLTGGLS